VFQVIQAAPEDGCALDKHEPVGVGGGPTGEERRREWQLRSESGSFRQRVAQNVGP